MSVAEHMQVNIEPEIRQIREYLFIPGYKIQAVKSISGSHSFKQLRTVNSLTYFLTVNQSFFLRQQLPFPATKPMVFWIEIHFHLFPVERMSHLAAILLCFSASIPSAALTGIEFSQLDLVPKGRKGVSALELVESPGCLVFNLSYCQFRKMEGLLSMGKVVAQLISQE